MDDFFDDCDGMEDAWDDKPDFEEGPTESENGFWEGPGERDWALIFPIAEEIAREKREWERTRREWDDDQDLDYWE